MLLKSPFDASSYASTVVVVGTVTAELDAGADEPELAFQGRGIRVCKSIMPKPCWKGCDPDNGLGLAQ